MNFNKFKNLIFKLRKQEKDYLRYLYLIKNKNINLNTKVKARLELSTLTKNKFKVFCWKTQTFRSINKNYKVSRHVFKSKYSNGFVTGIQKSIW
jgi:ribosomal protein S14